MACLNILPEPHAGVVVVHDACPEYPRALGRVESLLEELAVEPCAQAAIGLGDGLGHVMVLPAFDDLVGDKQRAARFHVEHASHDVLIAPSPETDEAACFKRASYECPA